MVKALVIGLFTMVSLTAHAAQDPTAPLGWNKSKPSASVRAKAYPLPTLQSIVCDQETQCFVMLNDKIVTKGQWVAGYQIQGITSERVTLDRAGKTWQLELFNSNVKL